MRREKGRVAASRGMNVHKRGDVKPRSLDSRIFASVSQQGFKEVSVGSSSTTYPHNAAASVCFFPLVVVWQALPCLHVASPPGRRGPWPPSLALRRRHTGMGLTPPLPFPSHPIWGRKKGLKGCPSHSHPSPWVGRDLHTPCLVVADLCDTQWMALWGPTRPLPLRSCPPD